MFNSPAAENVHVIVIKKTLKQVPAGLNKKYHKQPSAFKSSGRHAAKE